jgi:hypothetical protein
MLGAADLGGGVQPLFMQARLGIEQFGVPDPELPRGLVRIDPRPDIRLITHLRDGRLDLSPALAFTLRRAVMHVLHDTAAWSQP